MAMGKAPGLGEDFEASHDIQRTTLRHDVLNHMESTITVPKSIKLKPIIRGNITAL